MLKHKLDDGHLARSITPAGQLQPVSPQTPNQTVLKKQRTIGARYELGATGYAMAGHQVGSDESHQVTTGIQYEFGNGYGFGQAGQVAAGIQSRYGTPDQILGILHNAGMIGSYGGVMPGTNDIQNDTAAQDGVDTQRGISPSVHYGTWSQGGPDVQLHTGIWYNHGLFPPVTTIQPKTSFVRGSGGAFANPRKDVVSADNPQNTCLWIARLPANCTLKDLFTALAGCGKVYAASISPADPFYDYPAANVTFWDISGAEKLMAKVRQGVFMIGGVRPIVTKNRFLGRSQDESHKSRVMVVSGPDTVINRASLEGQVFEYFSYELEEVVTRVDYGWWQCLEYRFSSVGQAEDAVGAIRHFKERTDIHPMTQADWKEVKVRFEDDPCEKDSYQK
ncbi:hypothetical protein F5B18DRAFT_558470 [Nemania serpens]|nr:hypothetical protein F5B18DRAFT_558470 [Nemania serpens]